jgi:hypothetical protein
MEDTITTTYYLCDEFLKAIGHHDDPQVRLSTAEVMSIPLVACDFFSGNIEASRSFLDEYGYIPKAISKSRFNRRLHAIEPCLWRTLFDVLAEVLKHEHSERTYVVDSLPVAVCDNITIRRSRSSILQKNTAKPSVLHPQQTPLLLRVAARTWW